MAVNKRFKLYLHTISHNLCDDTKRAVLTIRRDSDLGYVTSAGSTSLRLRGCRVWRVSEIGDRIWGSRTWILREGWVADFGGCVGDFGLVVGFLDAGYLRDSKNLEWVEWKRKRGRGWPH